VAYSAFTDRTAPPDDEAIVAVVGSARPLWDRLSGFAAARCRAAPKLKFYGRNHGWALVYAARGRALLSLYPAEDGLTACVVIGEEPLAAALAAGAGSAVRDAAAAATPFREGRWLFIAVGDAAAAADVERLVEAKLAAR